MNGIEGEKGLPAEATGRAVEEYLAMLNDAAFGGATDVVPKFLSPADPAARWTNAHGGQAFFAYSTNYLIDADNAIIVDAAKFAAIAIDRRFYADLSLIASTRPWFTVALRQASGIPAPTILGRCGYVHCRTSRALAQI